PPSGSVIGNQQRLSGLVQANTPGSPAPPEPASIAAPARGLLPSAGRTAPRPARSVAASPRAPGVGPGARRSTRRASAGASSSNDHRVRSGHGAAESSEDAGASCADRASLVPAAAPGPASPHAPRPAPTP